MQLNPYVNFNGQCRAAFEFYARVLGGKIEAMITFDEAGMSGHVQAGWQDRIMHASLNAAGAHLMGSDASTADRVEKPQGFYVSLQLEEPAQADRIFQALSEGGEVEMPIQETDWAHRFGMLTDQFGIPWMVNCHKAS